MKLITLLALLALPLRGAEFSPRGEIQGDVLFLPGFADSYENHGALFAAWNAAGLRVITFDYPGHGREKGSLATKTVGDLLALARAAEKKYRAPRPLYLAGWSTGGLVAVRSLQGEALLKWERLPRAVVLFAPGVALRTIIGRPSWRYPVGEVTLGTLTHNPDRSGILPPRPKSPGLVPGFALSLLLESHRARRQSYPSTIPTLVVLAGEDDRYVDTAKVKAWAIETGATTHQCAAARHWLNREPADKGGPEAIALAVDFFTGGKTPTEQCRAISSRRP